MTYLSLFSGAGGGDLACQHLLGWECVGYVEWEESCVEILDQRIAEGCLNAADIYRMDVRDFNRRAASLYRGAVDVVTGGVPCQPFSVAGKRAGTDDERNMWPATWDAISLVEPGWCLLENVPGLLGSGVKVRAKVARIETGGLLDPRPLRVVWTVETLRLNPYLGRILGEMAELGYDCRWGIVSAADVGAPHLRKRLWIVAHASRSASGSGPERTGREARTDVGRSGSGATVAHAQYGEHDEQQGEILATDERAEPGRTELRARGRGESLALPDGGRLEERPQQHGEAEEDSANGDSRRRHAGGCGRSTWWDRDPADLPDPDEQHDDRSGHGAGAVRGDGPEQADVREGETDVARGTGNDGARCEIVESRLGRVVDGDADRLVIARPDAAGELPSMVVVPRVAAGVPNRVNRLKGLGNAQVPLCATVAWDLLHRDLIPVVPTGDTKDAP